MKKYIILSLAVIGLMACSKSTPAPTVEINTNGSGTGTGTDGTSYTTTAPQIVNTAAATIVYDAANNKIISVVTTNSSSQGVSTIDGGDVSVELTNLTDDGIGTVTNDNMGSISAKFTSNADPILVFKVKNTAKMTIDEYDVHINKTISTAKGVLNIQGNSPTAFNDKSVVWNAAKFIAMSKSTTQKVVTIKL